MTMMDCPYHSDNAYARWFHSSLEISSQIDVSHLAFDGLDNEACLVLVASPVATVTVAHLRYYLGYLAYCISLAVFAVGDSSSPPSLSQAMYPNSSQMTRSYLWNLVSSACSVCASGTPLSAL